jgi:Mn2+/Fe2+ NRAMP family transporter
MVFIVSLSSDRKIMGPWVNKKSTTVLGYVVVSLMALVSIAGIFSLF